MAEYDIYSYRDKISKIIQAMYRPNDETEDKGYKKLYYALFNDLTWAIDEMGQTEAGEPQVLALIEVQRRAEDRYIDESK